MHEGARIRDLALELFHALRTSLRLRLALIFAGGAIALAVALSGYQFLAYRFEIRARNRMALDERMGEVAAILRTGREPALEDEVVKEDAQHPGYQIWVRVLGGAHPVLETRGMDFHAPPELFTGRTRAHIHHHLLLLREEVHGERHLQAAMDVSEVERTIDAYQDRLIASLLVGSCLCAIFGTWAAHRGLKPLRRIAESTRAIDAHRLRNRLEPGRVPQELRELVGALNAMLDRLDRAFTRLSQFSGDLAHELRTPINNLMGEAEVALGRERSPEDYRQVLESSLEEYRRLSTLISRMLFLARVEDPATAIRARVVEAGPLLADVCAFFEAEASERGIRLSASGEGPLRCDPDLIRQVLANLVANALAATPEGGTVDLAFRNVEGGSEILVADTGRGIPSDEIPHLFDRFARTRESRERRENGTGLGLAIVQSIIGLHGGRLDLRSEPGRGTRVAFWIPGSEAGTPLGSAKSSPSQPSTWD